MKNRSLWQLLIVIDLRIIASDIKWGKDKVIMLHLTLLEVFGKIESICKPKEKRGGYVEDEIKKQVMNELEEIRQQIAKLEILESKRKNAEKCWAEAMALLAGC